MKRIGVLSILLIVVAVLFGAFARDSLYWKRRALAAIYSPATLPASYYEPSELIEGAAEGGSIPRVSPEQERLDPAALQAAVEYADGESTTALIVGRHGHIVFEHYWDGATFDSVIDAGAFSATLTAMAVGMAMSDRKIALPSEPVANYIESFRDGDRATITLEDLLHMTSGLGSNQGGVDPWTASTREQFVRDIRSECLDRAPWTTRDSIWLAQACDPQLLAHIIERATGQQYAAYISERLWKPIGAGDAHLMLDREGGTAHASCCLRARQGDWMRVAELLVTDGKFGGAQILPPGWVRTMLTPSKANRLFGYQVWRGAPLTGPPLTQDKGISEPYAVADTFLLKGNGKTRLWLVPSMGLSVLRVGTTDQFDTDWDDSRIPNLIIRGAGDYVPNTGAQGVSDLVPNH